MTRVSEITGHWLGLCRKPPVFRASQAVIVLQPEPVHEGLPDGGAGGPGTIRRGIGAALSGTKTLIHNPQLLWFSFLAGLVLGSLVGGVLLGVLESLGAGYLWPEYKDAFAFIVLVLILIIRPQGLLGARVPDKV